MFACKRRSRFISNAVVAFGSSILLLCMMKPCLAQGSITETTNVVNLAQAGLSLLGGISATLITLVRGSLGAEVCQKASLLSRRTANLRLNEGSVVKATRENLQGIPNVSNMILCAREAMHCAQALAQHIWSFGGGEALVIVLDKFNCKGPTGESTDTFECFKGPCTNWHAPQLAKHGLVQQLTEDEEIVVHSALCRQGSPALLGYDRFKRQRTVVAVIEGFPPEKTQESDISTRLTATLDESQRGAATTAHKIVRGQMSDPANKPYWAYSKEWPIWTWSTVLLAEWLITLALSGLVAIDSYNAALGARRIMRSYTTDFSGTADTPQHFAKRVQVEGSRQGGRQKFCKIEERGKREATVCEKVRMIGAMGVPLACQALWWLQACGHYSVLVKPGKRKEWQLWFSCSVIIVECMAGATVLWYIVGASTGFSGRYRIRKPILATFLFAAIAMAAIVLVVTEKLQHLSLAVAVACCGVVQQMNCWLLWFVGSQAALAHGTVNERAPWYSTTLLVLSFSCAAALVVSTGSWT
ncbi:hypothetical protein KP509_35G003900 [Ceratopteris richardii]|uniref:Transmembrane protein n=1 Tax=Ceratopteris richardii TaxID=49495 RepID=A0A8T2QDI5_CERRI|nr:hypothetical protein KP509_35G003900 [Ceratopteris richardii]